MQTVARLKPKKSGKRDSNPRPSAWEANALPTELLPQKRNTNLQKFWQDISQIEKFAKNFALDRSFLHFWRLIFETHSKRKKIT